MEQTQLEKASKLACDTVEACGLSFPPIDPFAIAKMEAPSLTLVGAHFHDAFDGQLEYHSRQRTFLLFFNTKYDNARAAYSHHPRTRFSIAHELGHFYIERHRAYLMGGGSPHGSKGEFLADRMVEREADAFAAGLLMPSKLLRPMVNAGLLTLSVVEDLAARFDTSVLSTAIRAVQLSDFPCAVLALRDGRIAWTLASSCLSKEGCYPMSRAPITSPTAKVQWDAFTRGGSQKASSSGRVARWFRTFSREDLADVSLQEEYLPVPSLNTLMVLLSIEERDFYPDMDTD